MNVYPYLPMAHTTIYGKKIAKRHEDVYFSRVNRWRIIWTLCICLASFLSNVDAAQVTLNWQDPNNNSAGVGGYNVYYWQTSWNIPASVNVGMQTTYTLTDMEAGQTYHFAVTAHDGNGGRESVYSNQVSKTFPVSIPVASFTMSPESGTAPLAVAFTNTSVGSITAWTWNFGDASTSTLQHPNHTYTTPGTYTVSLTVTNASGSDTATPTITVIDAGGGSGQVTLGGLNNTTILGMSEGPTPSHWVAITTKRPLPILVLPPYSSPICRRQTVAIPPTCAGGSTPPRALTSGL